MLLNTNNPWTGNTYNVSGGNDLYGSYYYVKATDINNNISLQSNTVTSSPTILVVDTLRRSVGIGRDTPLERLHVDGNVRLENGSLLFNGKDAANNNIGQMTGALHIQSAATTTGSTLFNLFGGNVGIGTSVPGAKLDVNGSVNATGNLSITGVIMGSNLSVKSITAQNLYTTILGASMANISTLTGNYLTVTGIKSATINTLGLVTTTLNSAIITANTLTSDVISANQLSVTGLSIGTLSGVAATFNTLTVTNGLKSYDANVTNALRVGTLSITTNAINTPSTLNIQNQTSGFQNTVFNEWGGSVGIGKTPFSTYKLDVNGIIKGNGVNIGAASLSFITPELVVDNVPFKINKDLTVVSLSGIGTRMVVADANGKLGIQPLSTVVSTWEKFSNSKIAYYAGDVCVGSTINLTKFNISGNTAIFPALGATDGVEGPYFGFTNSNTDFTNASDPIYFTRINEAPNKSTLRLIIGDDPGWDVAEDKFEIGAKTGTGFTPVASFKSTGKSTFYGIVDAKEFHACVVPGTCPDFVFQKGYNLMSLKDLKTYIDKNNHLPEVESAAIMEANGMDMKQMNLTLLKKVEELTIYLLNQNAEMQDMKKEMQALKTTLKK